MSQLGSLPLNPLSILETPPTTLRAFFIGRDI